MYDTRVQRIRDNEEFIKQTLFALCRQLLSVTAGYLASAASFKGISPFGVSFCACVYPEYIPAAILGTAIGYFYSYGVTVLTLRYIAASVVCGIASYVVKRGMKNKLHIYFSSAAAFVAVFVTGIILSMAVTVSAEEYLLYFAEGVLSSSGAWFLSKFLLINSTKRCVARLSVSDISSVLVVFTLILLSLGTFTVFSVSPCVVVGVYVILVAAAYGGEKFSALFGIVAAAVTDIVIPGSFLTGSVALGGLLAGIFGRRNRFFTPLIFMICVFASAFTSDDLISAVHVITAIGIACLVFVLTPPKITAVFSRVFMVSQEMACISGQKKVFASRLRIASDGMENVTSAVKAIAGIYRRRSVPKEENIYKNVCMNVCSDCRNYEYCWNRNYSRTKQCFADILNEMKNSEMTENRNFPDAFLATCKNGEKLIKSLSFELEKYRLIMRECAKTGETVNIVSDQFMSVSDLLSAYAENMEFQEEPDNEKTGIVYDMLVNDYGEKIQGVCVFSNKNNKIYCEINMEPDKYTDCESVIRKVGQVLDKEFEKPVVNVNSDSVMCITACEKTKYSVETGGYQISSDGGKWCGDSFDSFFDGKGRFYMILSDGMGTGKRAAADSVMCSSLSAILLKAGYPVECILRVINSAMLVRTGEESIATLDIVAMDLYTGEVCFYKAGASHSVVLKHQKLLKVTKPSLPIGILGDVKFEQISLTVSDGDAFVLMSDGVSEDTLPYWKTILAECDGFSGRELADRLTKSAHLHSDKNTPDDITVVVAKVRKQ